MFITLEGIEGCGKSTQIELLANGLANHGYSVIKTREPGGCPIANQIRGILLDAENRKMVPMAELMLYAAARAQHLAEIIRPALSGNSVVLCDRFSDATRAYQSFGRGIERQTIETLNHLACAGLSPDLTILLDCDVRIGLKRAMRRIESASGPKEDRFEQESVLFHEKVRKGYLTLAAEEPGRFKVVDASLSQETVASFIFSHVMQCLKAKD